MRQLTASIVIGVISSGFLAGCGEATGSATPTSAQREAVRAELQDAYDTVWGSPATRQALEVSAYAERQRTMGTCLAAQGLGYAPGPFLDATAPARGPVDWFDVIVPVDAASALEAERRIETPYRSREIVPTMRWEGPTPTAAAQARCEASKSANVDPPAADPALTDQLYELVAQATAAAAEQLAATYPDCLTEAGVLEVTARSDLVVLLENAVADPSLTQSWRASRVEALAADARCRSAAHSAAMAALEGPLTRFATEYATPLAELRAGAATLRRDAEGDAAALGLQIDWIEGG